MFDLPQGLLRRIALLVVAAFFLAIVPPYLPTHLELVYTSGVFEVMGGVGVLLPASRKVAGYGLIALLVAVYPANIHMALNPDLFPDMTATALYVRLPLQFVMGWLVWWATRAESIS